MKRFIFFFILLLTISLTAVHAKTLVVYYSYTGNCEAISNELSNQITADVLEIEPAEKGLRYEANNYELGIQLLNAIKANPNDAASYPAIDPVSISLSDYQNIIIVTPLWWSQMAALMQTFLFNCGSQMAGKNIGLIVSSASSGISGVERVVELADHYGVEMTQISLAWLLTKVESPIVGATRLHHIEGAVKSLDVHLSADDIRYLEEPYVPHSLSGVMAVNKPVMNEEPVWVAASKNK